MQNVKGKRWTTNKMKGNSYVDIEQSVSLGKVVLTLKKSWFYYFDLIFTILILLVFAFAQILIGLDCFKNLGAPDKIFGILLFIIGAIALFGIYRKLVESKLLVVEHKLSKSKVKQLLLEYFKDINGKNIIETSNCIVLHKQFSYYSKLYTFIIIDNYLYFNIVNQYPKTNPPVIIDHILLRDDLKKLFATVMVKNTNL